MQLDRSRPAGRLFFLSGLPLIVFFSQNLLWIGGLVIGLGIVDLLIRWGCRRLFPWLLAQTPADQQHWLELFWGVFPLSLRVLLWGSGVAGVLVHLPQLQNLENLIFRGWFQLCDLGISLIQMPLFSLGKMAFSLRSLLLFVGVTLAMFILSRGISRWIKRGILSRLRLDRGSQEAIATVITYVLSSLGLIIVLQTIGIDLSSLTVLAGVLGIGLGLSFQLLASNFISGLAILFEQPIKVGDFIEVDGLLGTVEKISFRSTVIRTNDGLYVIVPNNRFLEKNVVNWSYRNPETRIHVLVPVSYGTDTVLVTEALLAAARQDSRVLAHPTPTVWFRRFGDSAYEFELLVWINCPQDYDPIKSALNFLIEQELHYRSIEVPFPQRELHIRNPEVLRQIFQADNIGPDPLSSDIDGDGLPAPGRSLSYAPHQPLGVLLRKVDYFEQCTDTELRLLIQQGYQKFFPQGQVIFRQNDPGDSFYLILSGTVNVIVDNPELEQVCDRAQVIATLNRGEFFGEIAVLTGMPRSATVQAQSDAIVFVVDHHALQTLLQNHNDLAEQIAKSLAQRQQVSRELGLFDESNINSSGPTPLEWIRNRINTLFGLS
jgi:potassium-dependent mechanosensitive channel